MKLHFDIAKKGRNSTQVSFISYFFPQNDNLLTFFYTCLFFKLASKQSALSNYVLTAADKDRYQGLSNVRIVVSIVQRMCCNEKSSHLPKKRR